MDLQKRGQSLDETCLVYLADKCVIGNRLVAPEERFGNARERFSGNPEVAEAVTKRMRDAEEIKDRLESALGHTLEYMLRKYEKIVLTASRGEEKEIYLVRHGALPGSGKGKHFIGQSDFHLSEDGIQQARDLRDELRHTKFSAVYCSDLRRGIATAEIIAEPHRVSPIIRKDLREINLGEWDGLSFEEVRLRFPKDYAARGDDIVHFRTPGGESFLDCSFRVIPAFYEMIHSSTGNILIVGHAGVNRILLCQVLGIALVKIFEIKQNPGCLNRIRYIDSSFKLDLMNGVKFGGSS